MTVTIAVSPRTPEKRPRSRRSVQARVWYLLPAALFFGLFTAFPLALVVVATAISLVIVKRVAVGDPILGRQRVAFRKFRKISRGTV